MAGDEATGGRTSVAAKRGELPDESAARGAASAGGERGSETVSARVTITDPGATPQPTRAGGTATSGEPRQGD